MQQTRTRPAPEPETSPAQSGPGATDPGSNTDAQRALPPVLPESLWIDNAALQTYGAAERKFQYQRQVERMTPEQRAYLWDIQRQTPPTWQAEAFEQVDLARSSRPLTEADRGKVLAARTAIEQLDVKTVDDGSDPNLVQIVVTFDGTWNDRDQSAHDTNPAMLHELAPRGIYERGVGTDFETKLVGGATGLGAQNRIEDAYRQVVGQMAAERKERPEASFVLVLNGFSRGAATARAFANILDQRGVPGPGGRTERPRIGALVLFDTVTTGMSEELYDQRIPASVENVLHLTAANERRMAFPLTNVRPGDHRAELALPGAHADVGGGYPNAYSRLPLDLAWRYLTRLGVKLDAPAPGVVPDPTDPSLRLHDSSWALDSLLGSSQREVRAPRDR